MWAAGGVALLCATGDPPWKPRGIKSPYALMMAVLNSEDGPPLESYELEPDLRDFLDQCFTRDTDARPSAAQIARHRFLEHSAATGQAPPPPDDHTTIRTHQPAANANERGD